MGKVYVLFMLPQGNSSAKETFSPITRKAGEQLAGCVVPLLRAGSHLSRKAQMQFTLFVACHSVVESLATDLATM